MSAPQVLCCEWMNTLLQRAGEKGFALIAFNDGEYRAFYIQARPFEADVVHKYGTPDDSTGLVRWPKITDSQGAPVPYVLSMDLRIQYCPSCGANVQRWIDTHVREFDGIAERAATQAR